MLTSAAGSTKLEMKYPNGGLRITRTPGRRYAKNCVNLDDVIHEEHLESALAFSFFIGDEELFDHLPFSKSDGGVPVCAPVHTIRVSY